MDLEALRNDVAVVREPTGRSLRGHLAIAYGPGHGDRKHVQREVRHVSFAVGAPHAEDEPRLLTTSDAPDRPSVYHSNREEGLRLAQEMLAAPYNGHATCWEALGLGEAAQSVLGLFIPGIPINQQQDVGLHVTIYVANTHLQSYDPPSEKDVQRLRDHYPGNVNIELRTHLKVLQGRRANDLASGGLYYVAADLSPAFTEQIFASQVELGQKVSEFVPHLTLAILGLKTHRHPKQLSCLGRRQASRAVVDLLRFGCVAGAAPLGESLSNLNLPERLVQLGFAGFDLDVWKARMTGDVPIHEAPVIDVSGEHENSIRSWKDPPSEEQLKVLLKFLLEDAAESFVLDEPVTPGATASTSTASFLTSSKSLE